MTIIIDNKEFDLIDEREYQGKQTVWNRETIVLVENDGEMESLVEFVREKIAWINRNKEKIIHEFMKENDHYVDVVNEMIDKGKFKSKEKINYDDFTKSLFINNVWLCSADKSMMIDLDAEPDYLFGHLASMEIDSDYNIEFGGLNG